MLKHKLAGIELNYQRLFLFASAFFALFAFIYEMFSHGVYSAYMIFAFLIPLVLGGILDIYGTTNQKLILFPIFGICLLITSFIQRAFMVD